MAEVVTLYNVVGSQRNIAFIQIVGSYLHSIAAQ